MKKILPLLLLFTGMVNAQTINFPDVNFKTKLLSSSATNIVAADLSGNFIQIDSNNDGEIQVSEALNVKSIYVQSSSISNLTGIESFLNLEGLFCQNNSIASIDLSSLTTVTTLNCSENSITSINLGANTGLTNLYCSNNQLSSLNLSSFLNLTEIDCSSNFLTSLNITGLSNLTSLNYSGNQLPSVNLSSLTNLQYLFCSSNAISSLAINSLANLKEINVSNNSLTSFSAVNLANLQNLTLLNNSTLTSLTLSNLPALTNLNVQGTTIGSLDLSPFTSLYLISCDGAHLTNLNLNGLSNLNYISCAGNELTVLNTSSLTNLSYLNCGLNQLSNLDLSANTNLQKLFCWQNNLTSLDLTPLNLINEIVCHSNQISTIQFGSNNLLQILHCRDNSLTNLNTNNLSSLISLVFSNNPIASIDLSQNTILSYLYCENTQLTTLDCSNNHQLTNLIAQDNPNLQTLFIKNGASEYAGDTVYNCPNLVYICSDENQIPTILSFVPTNVVVNSYCSFTPGGNYNTITGTVTFDGDNNGCDASDLMQPNIRVDINDGSSQGATFSNASGSYSFFTQEGVFNLTPNVENPTWFNISPATANVSFADNNNNVTTQNFCIAPNGMHMDLEVVIEPITPARPGFDAVYKLVYRNKGNMNPQFNSGVRLDYNPNQMTFVSASQAIGNQGINFINFDYNNLLPFETREITVTFHINSPVDINPVTIGDVLQFHSNVGLNIGDENPDDNDFYYNQTVIGSYDPNDITCLQGTSLPTAEIGKYLYYVVNFENTGNYAAENVVAKVDIDATKYDINTLQLLNTSHPSYTRINGNKVEFIFEGINLDAASGNPPVGGHGNVLFKIKSKNTLNNGDSVAKRANIYFDYNAPVDTNLAVTTYQTLNNAINQLDETVAVYPNPTQSFITITSTYVIKSIELYDIQGRILESILESSNTTTLDISSRQNGIYFLKINTENGSKVEKIVKE